jgi:hypothetical protein
VEEALAEAKGAGLLEDLDPEYKMDGTISDIADR